MIDNMIFFPVEDSSPSTSDKATGAFPKGPSYGNLPVRASARPAATSPSPSPSPTTLSSSSSSGPSSSTPSPSSSSILPSSKSSSNGPSPSNSLSLPPSSSFPSRRVTADEVWEMPSLPAVPPPSQQPASTPSLNQYENALRILCDPSFNYF